LSLAQYSYGFTFVTMTSSERDAAAESFAVTFTVGDSRRSTVGATNRRF